MRDGPSGEETAEGSKSSLAEDKFTHDLNAMATELGLSKAVIKRADSVYANAATMRFSRSVPERILAAAALYAACREFRRAITLRDFGSWGCNPRDVGRCYTTIVERMYINRPKVNCKTYLHRLVLTRPLSEETYRAAEAIIRSSEGLQGRNPMTLAAAAVYIASCDNGERVTQDEIAEAAGIGANAVQKCCREIRALGGSLQARTTADPPQDECKMEAKRCNGFGDYAGARPTYSGRRWRRGACTASKERLMTGTPEKLSDVGR